ncbi:MAG TPA: phosphatase PAP2 family protein [Gaiellales bacterium]|jgi:PAP2 superfamily protein|nr:phosphatase PAP2 family protein [Gaiellales bacterium]
MDAAPTTRRSAWRNPRWLPKGWPDFVLQLVLFAVVDLLYELTRGLSEGSVATAFGHARSVVSWEQSLGIFNELDVQQWAIQRHWVLDIADFTYFHMHFVVTTVFMFWLYLRRNRHYYFIRNAVFVADGIALIGFTLFPTAPPRMLTDLGFTDTLDRYASISNYSGPVAALANPFAAVPSIHTCYSLIIGLSCFFLVRRRPLRVTWLFYPCLIVFSIIATANHFWLDAILGGLLACVALSTAWVIERYRPTLPRSARVRMRLEAPPRLADAR